MSQLGVMLLVFGLAVLPGLASRRMERSDQVTLVVLPILTFFGAVLPGIVTYGFGQDAATYVLGAAVVIVVATLNYRFQPKPRTVAAPADVPSTSPPTEV